VQFDFTTEIVMLCARIADRHPNTDCTEITIGNVLRASA
jgi:hypothetical protein